MILKDLYGYFSAGNILTSASEPGSAANLAETLKIKKYGALSHRYIFARSRWRRRVSSVPGLKNFSLNWGIWQAEGKTIIENGHGFSNAYQWPSCVGIAIPSCPLPIIKLKVNK